MSEAEVGSLAGKESPEKNGRMSQREIRLRGVTSGCE